MKISIIHPSRSRPEQCYETVKKWVRKAGNSFVDLEYIVSIDNSDKDLNGYAKIEKEYWAKLLISDNKSAIEAINNASKRTNGDLLIVVSDDFDCPENWVSLLLEFLEGKSDFIVKTQDGIQKTLITLPIMDRAYYNRFGYIYHPDYLHMWSDTEMTAVGHMLGRVIDLPLQFPHLHYSVGGMQKDAINAKNDATWMQGELLFNKRLKTNFGIENPVMEYKDIVWR